MNITPCTIKSDESAWGAQSMINFIESDTTPEAFDAFLAKNHPNYNFNAGGRCGWHALGYAADQGNVALIQHIVKKGGETLLDLGNTFGWTPLYCAAQCKNLENGFKAAKLLLSLGSKINMATNSACGDSESGETPKLATPLWAAAVKTKNIELVKLLLVNGGAIDPETEEAIFHPASRENRLPLTGINQAKAELKEDSEKWKFFRCTQTTKNESRLQQEVVLLIGKYFFEKITIPKKDSLKPDGNIY